MLRMPTQVAAQAKLIKLMFLGSPPMGDPGRNVHKFHTLVK